MLASILIGDVAGVEAGGELAIACDAAAGDRDVLHETVEQATATITASRKAIRAMVGWRSERRQSADGFEAAGRGDWPPPGPRRPSPLDCRRLEAVTRERYIPLRFRLGVGGQGSRSLRWDGRRQGLEHKSRAEPQGLLYEPIKIGGSIWVRRPVVIDKGIGAIAIEEHVTDLM